MRRCAEQDVILTVPASFDPAARELTAEAAAQAGLEKLALLEEPQAAFYHWIHAGGDAWRSQVKPGRRRSSWSTWAAARPISP